jgi:hypothetical protein
MYLKRWSYITLQACMSCVEIKCLTDARPESGQYLVDSLSVIELWKHGGLAKWLLLFDCNRTAVLRTSAKQAYGR